MGLDAMVIAGNLGKSTAALQVVAADLRAWLSMDEYWKSCPSARSQVMRTLNYVEKTLKDLGE